MLCDMGRRIFYCILIYWKIQLLILILSLIKVLEAQTVSLQLCNSPTKGSACQILCTTTNHTQDVTFTSNGNQRGTCTIIGGSSICGANTNQPSGTVTTYDITTLSRTSDEGSWVCSYGSATDTKTLTVLTFPSTPSSADITHSSGMTTDLQASLYQTVNLAVVMDCTYPQPTVTWRFKKCSSTSALTSKSGNVAEDVTASTVCGSPEKNYESTASISSGDGVAGNCVEPEVDIIVNGVTAHTVTAGFTITFPGEETRSEEPTTVHGSSTTYFDTTETAEESSPTTDLYKTSFEAETSTETSTQRNLNVDDNLLAIVVSSLVGGIILITTVVFILYFIIKRVRKVSKKKTSNTHTNEGMDNIGMVQESYSSNHNEGKSRQGSKPERMDKYKPKSLYAPSFIQDVYTGNQRSDKYENESDRHVQSSSMMSPASYCKTNDVDEVPTNIYRRKDRYLLYNH